MIKEIYGMNGIIWDKKNKSFVPISTIKSYKTLQNEKLRESRRIETYKFNGENIYFLYFNDKDVFQFYNHDKQVTGVCGELWTMMSELLNFTMVLIKTDVRTLGSKYDPNGNFTGLLGLMQQGNFTIIPRMEAYITRLEVVDFTSALWKEHYRIFIRPNYQFKITWMLQLFPAKFWLLIIIFYILLSILSIVSQKMIGDANSYKLIASLQDHFFYVFGAFCNQGEILYIVQNNSKILSFCISMFSWMIMISFNSQLIIYITETVVIKPFVDLETLLHTTDYIVLAEKNSVAYIAFTKNLKPIYTKIKEAGRIHYYSSYEHIWDLTCDNKRRFAVLQSEHIKVDSNVYCSLYPIGPEFFKTWVVAGIAKNFPYKKTINHSIIKFYEYGIINVLMSRWLRMRSDNTMNVTNLFSPITLYQVYLPIGIYLFGLCTSIIILIIESIMMILKGVPEKRVGIRPKLTSGYNGLLRYIEQNSSDVIVKIEIYPQNLDVVDFLLPLWNDRFSHTANPKDI
ncbi:uncharacterized protein LOC131670673 [Phymastichus coffea]|uniref:uncharacterized protein LOC131670673 n=1 Tax=Phymastichus coffea TaxID=108790 RepID=UPI00273A7621|nr:uncharacterized protein LOC131670673 [Phymastichus coffea]